MLMNGTSDMFRLINRDELSHVRLFQKMLPEAMETFPFSKDKIYEMFDAAVKYEINWVNHIIGENVLGITPQSTEQYTKYLANIRLKAIGLESLYDEDIYQKNVYQHLEKQSDTGKNASTKANFFETTVSSYQMASAIRGWDDF